MEVSDEVTELRDAVARLVMGWSATRMPWAYEGVASVWHDGDGVPLMACAAWRPEDDAAQRARVLDAMVRRGFGFEIAGDGAQTRVAFSRDGQTMAVALDADRARALLRAALATVEADRETGDRAPVVDGPAT
ncbi:MAG: hypothetical protein H6983_20245 [Ectothiorhodospiraceae bacterium]|nr:hypothetical protein [Chromatiales bacterium]MCP5156517.1 hypothetical protein [Ectothiorhodospiraceae bacterium]